MALTPKALSHAPKNPTRRSKEERERLDKRESQLRQARADASAADAAAESAKRRAYFGIQRDQAERRVGPDALSSYRGGLGGSMRYVRGGRGGFMGQRTAVPRELPTGKKKKKVTATQTETSRSVDGGASASADLSASVRRRSTRRGGQTEVNVAATEVEHAKTDIKTDPDGDVAMVDKDTELRPEEQDPSYISSDEEKALGQNIEFINLISDDDDDEIQGGSGGEESSRRRVAGLQPLRLIRRPHRDRNMPFNTDASSVIGPSVRRDTRDRYRVEENLSRSDVATSGTRKGKSRSGDGDALKEPRRATGMHDSGTSNLSRRSTKREGDGGAGSSTVDAPMDNDMEGTRDQTSAVQDGSDAETKEAVAARIRNRRKSAQAGNKQPAFQTWEEEREYLRQLQDFEDVQYELGNISVAPAGSSTADAEAVPDKKDDAVYLFQLPPIIPDLIEPSIKQEPQSPERTARVAPATSTLIGNPTTSGPIKIEDDANITDDQGAGPRQPRFAAGKAGKLRVHKSGRATLTWGGTSMEVSQGINPYFLQSVVLANMKTQLPDEASGAMALDGATQVGEATSFGQVRGKLVVTPDWSEILG